MSGKSSAHEDTRRRAEVLLILGLGVGCSQAARDEAALAEPPQTEAAANEPLDHARYAALHDLALEPAREGWADALDELAVRGDAFTLVHFSRLDRQALGVVEAERLDRTLAALERRRASSGEDFRRDLPRLLERAAWMDLMCDPLESTLPEWTRGEVAARLDEPGMREEVERLRDGFRPDGEDCVGFGSLSARVREYAAQILSRDT